jgi:transposase
MDIQDARTLSPEAQQALRERVIRALETQEHLSVSGAARTFGVHRATVSEWWSRYQRGGAGALASKKRGAKPGALLTAEQEARLLTALRTKAPGELGLGEALWTREAVAAWAARELGLKRSRWVWGRWLKAKGFTPQKPARRAYEHDRAAVERWLQEEYPRIEAEAKAEGAEIHWLDEAGLRSDCQHGRGYAPRGQTPVQQVPGKRFSVNYIATVTNLGVLRFMVFAGRFTAAVLLVFLARLLASRAAKVYVILDGHPSHRSKRTTAWAAERADRLRLVFLPSYSPELNPAEYLNNDVKGNAQRSGRARDADRLADQLRSYLRATQCIPSIVKAYFKAKHVKYAA